MESDILHVRNDAKVVEGNGGEDEESNHSRRTNNDQFIRLPDAHTEETLANGNAQNEETEVVPTPRNGVQAVQAFDDSNVHENGDLQCYSYTTVSLGEDHNHCNIIVFQDTVIFGQISHTRYVFGQILCDTDTDSDPKFLDEIEMSEKVKESKDKYDCPKMGTSGSALPNSDAKTQEQQFYISLDKLQSKLFQRGEKHVKASGKRQRRKKLIDLLGIYDTFRYFEPAQVCAAVFPVSRQSRMDSQSSQGAKESSKEPPPPPQPPPGENRKWPPDSLYGLPWSTFRQELHRLGTFMNLPANSPVFALRLAQAGFLRFPDGAIFCFFCGLQRDEWNHGESPVDVHRRLRSDCPMVTGEGSENQPVMELSEERLQELMELWSLSGPPLLPGLQAEQGQRAVEVADAVGMVSQPTQTTSRAANPSAFSTGRSPTGAPLTADLSADGHPSAPATGSGGAQASAPSDRRASPSAASANPSGSGASPLSAQAAGNNSGQRDQQPPRMGLMGGNADSANPPAPRGPIFDGTAQPEPPRVPADNASTEGSEPRAGQQVVTYQQLGIVTEAPKRPDMAMINSRVGSFRSWPSTASHTPLQLAEAGFYYAGYADCGRCFFCGGGLKNWEPVDNPWVEHARWFPKCAYIRQCQGQDFIDVVQELNVDRCPISQNRVTEEINRRRADGERIQEPVVDPAISSVLELGVSQEDVDAAVLRVQREGHLVTAERLFDSLLAEGLLAAGGASSIADSEVGQVDELVTENNEIRQQRMCKICLDKESCIVFLPCGHLVCCAECSPALKHCPMCRQRVKGRVRAFPA